MATPSKTIRGLLLILFLTIVADISHAQGVDPTLAGMIYLYTEKAERQYQSQEQAMLMISTGHIWTKAEVEETRKLQEEFNDYLDSFRGIIVYAAQIYGFYHEIDRIVANMGDLTNQLSRHPTNALAVALSAKRNQIYRDLILNSIDIVNDIRSVCLSKTKMTEKERIEVVFGIRPKLKLMNKKLKQLTKAVKYTSMTDIWYEIEDRTLPKANIKDISKAAHQRWRRNGKL